MKKRVVLFGIFLLSCSCLFPQVAVNATGAQPDPSAGLDVNFTDKGVLLPRLTFEQRNAIPNPAEGLMVYCTNCNTDGTGLISIFQGGEWKTLHLSCDTPVTPSAGTQVPSVTQVIWNWSTVPVALGYKWNTINDYASAYDMGTSTTKTETGLTCWTTYDRYVWAYNACGHSPVLALTGTTSDILFTPAPTEGLHVPSQTQITWNWNAIPGATGYKWNTSGDYSSALDMGTNTSRTETGLACATAFTRYIWAYNACGASNGTAISQSTNACSSSCPGSITDARDGKVYNTVSIGSQCWMAQNMNIGTTVSGADDQTNNGIIEKYCWGNLESNCDIYGGLYQWAEMVQYLNGATNTTSWNPVPTGNVPGICPAGWHLPTETEWTTLTTFLGGITVAGGQMKETGTEHWASPNTGATNTSNFTARGAGYRFNSGSNFSSFTYYAYFWSSTEMYTDNGGLRSLIYDAGYVSEGSYPKVHGFSVRCLMD